MWDAWGTAHMHRGFWCEDFMKKDDVEELGIDGRIILNRIDLVQDRVSLRALMRAIIYLWVPYNAGNLLNSFGTNILSRMTLLHGFS